MEYFDKSYLRDIYKLQNKEFRKIISILHLFHIKTLKLF